MFVVIFLLVAFAISDAHDCSEEKNKACIENTDNTILSHAEACEKLLSYIECLRGAQSECPDESSRDEVKRMIRHADFYFHDFCKGIPGINKCFEENSDYIKECIFDESAQTLFSFEEGDDSNESDLPCSIYNQIGTCFMEKIQEKCKDFVHLVSQEDVDAFLSRTVTACEAAGGIHQFTFGLNRKK